MDSTKQKTIFDDNSETFILYPSVQHYCSLDCVSPDTLSMRCNNFGDICGYFHVLPVCHFKPVFNILSSSEPELGYMKYSHYCCCPSSVSLTFISISSNTASPIRIKLWKNEVCVVIFTNSTIRLNLSEMGNYFMVCWFPKINYCLKFQVQMLC